MTPVRSPKDHGFDAVFSAATAQANTGEKGAANVENNLGPTIEDGSDLPPVDRNVWPSPNVGVDIAPA